MRLPKWFFNVVLFPGVIFHEISHFIACIILGVRVTETKFWGLEEAHVKHEEPSLLKTAFITTAPLTIGTILSFLLISVGHKQMLTLKTINDLFFSLSLYWLALSVCFHGFPSSQDAENALNSLKEFTKKHFFLSILLSPLILPLLVFLVVIDFLSVIPRLGLLWFVGLFVLTAVLL